MRRRAAGAALLLVAVLHMPAGFAQSGISLRDVLRESLALSPAALLQRQQVLANQGAVMQAQGQFDPVFTAAATRSDSLRPLRQSEKDALSSGGIPDPIRTALGLPPAIPTTLDRQISNLIDYSTGVQIPLQNGMTLSGSVGVTTTWDNISQVSSVPPQTSGRIGFNVRAPLLRNAGRDVTTANLSAAELELSASRDDQVFVNAQTLLGVASAYWAYLGSFRRLEITREAEARSKRLVEEVQKLIDAQEIPAADAQLVQASHSERAASRIGAEQAVAEGRRNLAAQIGLPAERGRDLPPPSEDFPKYDGNPITVDARSAALREMALARRSDLSAVRLRERAATRRLEAARSGLKPQLDVTLGVNYGTLVEKRTPFELGQVLSTNTAGPSISLTLSAQLPWNNSAAGGTVLAQLAVRDSSTIRVRALHDSIGNNVQTGAMALVRSAQQLARATEATRAYRLSVESELTRRRMGLSTLMDVINMQDRLTNALLTEVQARQTYANAIAQLRFETGTIVTPRDESFEVSVDDFLYPRFDVQAQDAQRRSPSAP